jgi:hypothetical protein
MQKTSSTGTTEKTTEQPQATTQNKDVTEYVPEGQSVFQKTGGVSGWYNKGTAQPATNQ